MDENTFDVHGLTVRIERDSDSASPDDWGNTDLFLVTTRNRYFEVECKGFTIEGCKDGAYKSDYHVLPLYAYIHSGVALSVRRGGQFSCPWDSEQIGYALVRKRAGFRNILKVAESLVAEWNTYLSGDVWGYTITDADGDLVDSCWGFYGHDDCAKEARNAAKYAEGKV